MFWARLEAAKARDEGDNPVSRPIISDISEHKRAEDERSAQKNLMDAVMESLPVGLALMDARGRTTLASPEFERIRGSPDARADPVQQPCHLPRLVGGLRPAGPG